MRVAHDRRHRSRKVRTRSASANSEPLGIEATLWRAADKLRGSMDASEYKHVVLGLIFLKYVDDALSERRDQIATELTAEGYDAETIAELIESRDEYTAAGAFWLPPEARWPYLQAHAKQPEIGKLIDEAMDLVELDNTSLRGVLPRSYSRPSLDQRRLGELVDLIATIGVGSTEQRNNDVLGRVYEYFIGRFASSEGKGGGEFYTPRPVVQLLVEMIEPYQGRVYDPCCGSGGMFVQSERFVEAHGGQRNDISIFGEELNDTTWRLAKMNLAIRGIEADLGPRWGDSFHDDLPRGPESRLHPRQPSVQYFGLGRRTPARGRTLGIRYATSRQCQLRLASAHGEPPFAAWGRWCGACKRIAFVAAVR